VKNRYTILEKILPVRLAEMTRSEVLIQKI